MLFNIQPVVMQYLFEPKSDQTDYINFCHSHGIVLTNFQQSEFKEQVDARMIINMYDLAEENENLGKSPQQLYLRYTVSVPDLI